MRRQLLPSPHHERLFAAAVLWLLAGGFALLTTLVPAHTELLGWAPLFWLLGAPLAVLLVLEPGLPRRLLGRRTVHRARSIHGVVWH